MAAGTRSGSEAKAEPVASHVPEIAVCESCPGKAVFLESGNTDGWIASDVTVEVRR
jgi:hypothetical protein